jgi:hypothetical protein
MGNCVMNPCANTQCGPGEVCAVIGGSVMCVPNQCGVSGCSSGEACCQGTCHSDPCALTRCPAGNVCKVDVSSCLATCEVGATGPKEEIFGGGGGGACDMGMGDTRSGAWLILPLLLLVLRRRRGEVR